MRVRPLLSTAWLAITSVLVAAIATVITNAAPAAAVASDPVN